MLGLLELLVSDVWRDRLDNANGNLYECRTTFLNELGS